MALDGNDCSIIKGWVRNHSGKITKDNLIHVGAQCEISDNDISEKGLMPSNT